MQIVYSPGSTTLLDTCRLTQVAVRGSLDGSRRWRCADSFAFRRVVWMPKPCVGSNPTVGPLVLVGRLTGKTGDRALKALSVVGSNPTVI